MEKFFVVKRLRDGFTALLANLCPVALPATRCDLALGMNLCCVPGARGLAGTRGLGFCPSGGHTLLGERVAVTQGTLCQQHIAPHHLSRDEGRKEPFTSPSEIPFAGEGWLQNSPLDSRRTLEVLGIISGGTGGRTEDAGAGTKNSVT